jgi:hypothetical protein
MGCRRVQEGAPVAVRSTRPARRAAHAVSSVNGGASWWRSIVPRRGRVTQHQPASQGRPAPACTPPRQEARGFGRYGRCTQRNEGITSPPGLVRVSDFICRASTSTLPCFSTIVLSFSGSSQSNVSFQCPSQTDAKAIACVKFRTRQVGHSSSINASVSASTLASVSESLISVSTSPVCSLKQETHHARHCCWTSRATRDHRIYRSLQTTSIGDVVAHEVRVHGCVEGQASDFVSLHLQRDGLAAISAAPGLSLTK